MSQLDNTASPTQNVDPNNPMDKSAEQALIDHYFKPQPYVEKEIIDRPLKVPEYLPDVDGNPWKVWPYPEVIDFEPDLKIPPPRMTLPPGVKVVGNDFDPETFDLSNFGIFNDIVNWIGYVLVVCNLYRVLKHAILMIDEVVLRTPSKPEPPEGEEEESSSEGE